jgi:hypothetical protein
MGGDSGDEALLGQEGQRLQSDPDGAAWRPGEGAGVSSGQHPDRGGAEGDRVLDTGAVGHPTVDEELTVDEHRRVQPGHGGAGADGGVHGTGGQQDGVTGEQVRGNQVRLDRGVREVVESRVLAHQFAEPVT